MVTCQTTMELAPQTLLIRVYILSGNYLCNVCHFPRLLRRTAWRLQYSQRVRGNLAANQLLPGSCCSASHSCERSSSPVWSFCPCCLSESKRPAASKDAESEKDLDDFTVLKSLADGRKSKETTEVPPKKEDQHVPDESDSTKSRRLAEDYDSTKTGMDYGKYQGTHTCHCVHGIIWKGWSGWAAQGSVTSDFPSACVTFARVAKGRRHAAASFCLSLTGYQADILRKSRQKKHVCVCVMGMSMDREKESKAGHVHAREEDYPLPLRHCSCVKLMRASVPASSLHRRLWNTCREHTTTICSKCNHLQVSAWTLSLNRSH